MTQLEADKQAHLMQCEQLRLGMDNIVKDLPHDDLTKKYAKAVSSVAGLTSQLASIMASEQILQVRPHFLQRACTSVATPKCTTC